MTYQKKFIYSLPVSCFFFLTVCFFSSMEVYIANYLEFMLPIKHVWWIMLSATLGFAVVFSAAESFLSTKAFTVLNAFVIVFTLCFYIQSMFLNGHIRSFTGEIVDYSGKIANTNIVVWIAVAALLSAAFFFINKKVGLFKINSMFLFISLAFIFIQASGFITAVINMPRENGSKNAYLSTDGEFELSSGNNVVEFIIDTCDGQIVENALKKYPDLFSEFGGFTYYPNMTSAFSRTFPSVPYMLTGEFCYFDKPYSEYIYDAWSGDTLVADMKSAGADVRIFTDPDYLDPSAIGIVDNYYAFSGHDLSLIHPGKLFLQMMHLSGYLGMPYMFKELFSYTAQSVSMISMETPPDYVVYENDTDFLAMLMRYGITVNSGYDSAFRFYHLWGTHPGHSLGADLSMDSTASDEDALCASLKIISMYLYGMKEQGVYDDSTIIITADHGYSEGRNGLLLDGTRCCILMIKPAGADNSEKIQTSCAPVCHDDLSPTIKAAFGIACADNERTVYEIAEDEDRERYYYHSAYYDDLDGEIALREYKVGKDATDFKNWEITGQYWDIDYSQRDVAKTRLSDIEE